MLKCEFEVVPVSDKCLFLFFFVQAYLSQFFSDVGVSAPNTVRRSALDSFDDTLRKMQEYFGLEVTGQLDSNTMEVMARPRCGFTDVTRYSHFDGEPKWEKPVVTYRYYTRSEQIATSLCKQFTQT